MSAIFGEILIVDQENNVASAGSRCVFSRLPVELQFVLE